MIASERYVAFALAIAVLAGPTRPAIGAVQNQSHAEEIDNQPRKGDRDRAVRP